MTFEELRIRNKKAAQISAQKRRERAAYPDLKKVAVYSHIKDEIDIVCAERKISAPKLIEMIWRDWIGNMDREFKSGVK